MYKLGSKALSWLLVVTLVLSSFPMGEGVKAEESSKKEPESATTSASENEQDNKELVAPESEEAYLPVEKITGEDVIVSEGNEPGTYDLEAYDDAARVTNNNGELVPIDSNLERTENGFSPKATALPVNFDSSLQSESPFLMVGEDASTVSFTLKGLKYEDGFLKPKETQTLVRDNQVWHQDVFPNTDLRHIALNDEVKEDLIFNQSAELPLEIIYEFKTGLKPVLKDNQITFYQGENIVMTMPVPEMQDSEVDEKSGLPNRSLNIKYELNQNSETEYELKIVPDQTWLQDPTRVYPIYVDPTLARNATLDTFVSSKYPNTNMNKYWSSTRGEYVLWIGYYDSTTGTNYGLIKFPALSDLRGATISSAALNTYVTWSYYATQQTGLWVDRANASWSETGVTWDTRPTSTKLDSTNVARDQWANFDVTSYTSQIAAGTRSDYGFKLHTDGNSTTHWKQITASETGTNRTRLNVSYSYPQMSTVTTEGFLTTPTSTTGYINLSWPAMSGATGYRLQMFDGKGWQTIYTGASRAYTTKDKGIFPKESQYVNRDASTDGIKFRSGDGQDLLVNPSNFFNKSSGTTTNTLSYQFRVIADYKLGSGSASPVAKRSLQELVPDMPTGLALKIEDTTPDDRAQFTLEWSSSEHATSYDVYAFNGFAYELIDNVKETSWSPNGKRLFPTPQQINTMPINTRTAFRKGDGQDFPGDPRPLYQKNNPDRTTYHDILHYYFRVYAKSAVGQSKGSEVRTMNVPAPRVSVQAVGYSDNRQANTGFLFANWKPVPGAAGYNVYLYNGRSHDLVETISGDVTSWHSRNKKLWPLENQSYKLNNNGIVGQGGELPVDPSPNYRLSGGSFGDRTNYWVRITAYRDTIEGMDKNVLLASNFVSEGNVASAYPAKPNIMSSIEPDLGTEEFYPMLDTSIGSFNVLKEHGNQFIEENDHVLPGRGPTVSADRYFNSQNVRLGMFGLGWHSGLERRLEIPKEDDPKVVRYIDADGSGHLFLRTVVNNGAVKLLPPAGVDYEFIINKETKEYIIQSTDGEREIYNASGRLDAIEYEAKDDTKKNRVRFIYEEVDGSTRLKAVYAASDDGTSSPNRLAFTYNEKGWVREMTVSASSDQTLDSRTYRYSYDAGDRLVKVESFKDETPIEVYAYEYKDSVEMIEETGKAKLPSFITRLELPGHTATNTRDIVSDIEGSIPTSVKEIDGTKTVYKNVSNENSENRVYQVSKVNEDNEDVEAPISFSFDASGHLVEEKIGSKATTFKWQDNRITDVTNPDNSIEKNLYHERETADLAETNDTSPSTELSGSIKSEQDATSQTTYEYAKNGKDVIEIKDEFGLAEEVALNEDREEIMNHEEPEERIGFTEYDSRGNIIREGVALTPGVNLYTNGGFEASETVTPGTLVTGGRNGKALQLNSATFTRDVNVKAGHPYNLGIDMRTTGTAKGSVTLTLLNSSNVSVDSYVIRPMGNLNEWTRRFVEFTAPVGAVKVRVAITSEGGSTLFDEVQLDTAKQGHAVSASAFNHVEQGGFDGTNKWQLVNATASHTGYMSNTGLNLQAGGSAKQTILVNQTTAKPFYISALAQKASESGSLNVVGTYEDGTTVQKTSSFNALNYTDGENASTWQRQTVQLTSESNKKLVKVDVILQNDSTTNIIVDSVRASVGRVISEVTYDKQGNHVLREAGLSKLPVINSVDAFGNVLTIKQENRTRQNKYDLLGRLIETKTENGTIIAYDYNERGEVTQKTFGKTVKEDDTGTVTVTDPGTITKYAYTNGRITSVTGPNGQQYKYSYETNTGNLTEMILPSGRRLVNVYDEEGKITELKEANTTRFKYGYDSTSGEITSIQMGSDTSNQKKYEYNTSGVGIGRILNLTDYKGVIQSWEYEDDTFAGTELLRSRTIAGTKHDFTYDAANRNDSVKAENQKWSFRHNEDGRITQITMPGQGGESLVEFDETGAVSTWSASAGDKQIAFERYSYDQYGNLSGLKKDEQTANYSYDATDQLIEEKTLDGQTISYAYDKRGNRTKINNHVVAEFDESNRMIKFNSQAITYDADGNRINDGRLKYSWDGLGNLTAIEEVNGTKKWQFIYDEQGRRIQKTGPSGTIHFHYDGDSNRLIAETDTSGKSIREYLYSADHVLVGLKISGTWYNYHRNYRGDVVAITDTTGNVSAKYTYDTWGKPLTTNIIDSKVANQPIRYASYYYDEDLALYYLMARYYHPDQAVFLSTDPQIESESTAEMFNGYSYVGNNPLIKIDPAGEVPLYVIVYGVVIAYKVFKTYKNYKKIKLAAKAAKTVNAKAPNRLKLDLQFFAKKNRAKGGDFRVYSAEQLRRMYGWGKDEFHRGVKELVVKKAKKDNPKELARLGSNPDLAIDSAGNIQLVSRTNKAIKPVRSEFTVHDFQ